MTGLRTTMYLQMSTKSVKLEELAGLVTVAARFHLTTEQNITAQQANLRPHVHPVHFLTHVDELGLTCTHMHTQTSSRTQHVSIMVIEIETAVWICNVEAS